MIVDNALYRGGVRVPVDCSRTTWPRSATRRPTTPTSSGSACTSPTRRSSTRCEEVYGLHPLAVEDALTAHQRPKLERYDETLFLVLKTLWYVDETDAVETGEVNLFVGKNFVVWCATARAASCTRRAVASRA